MRSAVPSLGVLARVDGVLVRRVDGHWVRDRLDVEFTNGSHHFVADYIPEDEIWLDREARDAGHEWRFWMRYQLVHRRRMAAGANYLEALAAAERAERGARRAALHGGRDRSHARLARLARRRQLGTERGCKVFLVRGRVVRDLAYVHFTMGGHRLRYRFVPDGEIWIDDAVEPTERAAVLHHEMVELELMAERGMSYPDAHKRASAAEVRFRRDPYSRNAK